MRRMIKGNQQNENETQAPQPPEPHDPKCNTNTHEYLRAETIKRMRAVPERIAKFEEVLRALREANTR